MKFGMRELLFFTVMLALLASSYVFVFQRSNAQQEAKRDEIRNMQRQLADLRQATVGIADLGVELNKVQQAIVLFDSKLPQEKEFDKILKELSQMAETNSLITRTVRTLKNERFAGYSEQPIQMSLSGDFNGFYAFLLQLEKLPCITRITQMDLKKIPDHEGAMEASITMSIFFEPDSAAATVPAKVAMAQ